MTTGDEPSLGGDKRIDTSGAEPTLGGEAAILHLVEMLKHTDRKVRYRAALRLAETGDERVFDTLVEMLQDENGTPRLRYRAAMALGYLGDERAIEPLVASIDTVNPYCVVKALSQIGGDRVLDVIEGLFFSHWPDDDMTDAIRQTMRRIGDQRVINFLINTIENAAAPIGPGSLAAVTLMYMGDQIVEPLLPLLNHQSNHVRLHAIVALSLVKDERLVEPLIALLDDENMSIVREVVYRLGMLGDQRATPHLIEMLDHPDSATVRNAVKALGMLGDERAVEPLLKVLDGPKRYLRHPASRSLWEIDHPTTPAIIGRILLEGEAENPEDLIYTLAAIGTDEARQTLAMVISQSRAARVRNDAAFALGNTKDPRSVEPLVEILLNHPDPEVRGGAAQKLEHFPDKCAIEALNKALTDEDDSVRWYAALSLSRLDDNRAVELQITVLNEGGLWERTIAANNLGESGDTRSVEPLIYSLLNDPNIDRVAASAAKALGRLGDRRAVDPLIAAIAQGRAVEAAATALGQLGDKRAVEPLIEALNDFNNDISAVATALGKLGDERAIEPLKIAMHYADQEITNFDRVERYPQDRSGQHCVKRFRACKEALEKIGTPEALAAIEDLPFRDLGDES